MQNEISIDVSVIVPVYNASKYLNQCVDSIVNQTHKNIEIIFVDDGSTDNSVEILEQYRATDSRIKIIRQTNQYAGVARNNGMKAAMGKYLMFLDADDFFELNMLENLYTIAEKEQLDILISGYYTFDGAMPLQLRGANISKKYSKVYSPQDFGEKVFQVCSAAPWNKFFLRSFVIETGVCFKPTIKCNDTYFSRMTIALARRIAFSNQSFVHYRTNNCNSLQGNVQRGIICYGQAVIDIKQGLLEKNIYYGSLRTSFIRETLFLIHHSFSLIEPSGNADVVRCLYEYYREKVLCEIADIEQEIPDATYLHYVFSTNSFDEFLLEIIRFKNKQIEEYRNNYVSMNSCDYKIGNSICTPLRKIKRMIKSGNLGNNI